MHSPVPAPYHFQTARTYTSPCALCSSKPVFIIAKEPGRPTPKEWDIIRGHAAHTNGILSRIGTFANFASVAGAHYEQLDEKGDPDRLTANNLRVEAIILATARVYDAVTANRPYWAAIQHDNVIAGLEKDIGTAHHRLCAFALAAGLRKMAQDAS